MLRVLLQETYLYACALLDAATAHADGRSGRALLVGGGIANFTDVAATFRGIIQALRERAAAIKAARMRIFVRRGEPPRVGAWGAAWHRCPPTTTTSSLEACLPPTLLPDAPATTLRPTPPLPPQGGPTTRRGWT